MPSNHLRADLETFRALERLPKILRMEICFAARVWDASDILPQYNRAVKQRGPEDATGWMIASIRVMDEQNLREFAAGYRQCYGIPLPHAGASATILRYQPARGMRRYRMPAGAAPRLKAAWRASEWLLPR